MTVLLFTPQKSASTCKLTFFLLRSFRSGGAFPENQGFQVAEAKNATAVMHRCRRQQLFIIWHRLRRY